MKFMLTWKVHENKRHEALAQFSKMTDDDDKADLGNNIKRIGRWHDVQGFTGVEIFETDDPKAIANHSLNWNGLIDILVTPVLDDEETREIGRIKFP